VRNLVIAPAGGRSLHREWMSDPAARSYDVWLQCYEDASLAAFRGDPVRLLDARGTMKWQGMARLLAERRAEVLAHDAVWFPDDDLSLGPAAVERLFEAVHALDLWLAQPALTEDSHVSHPVTLHHRGFTVRFTNFVEVMAPAFSRSALERCMGTFGESISGWGLDRVWPTLLGGPADRIAIVDAVQMRHTKPVAGGAWYAALAEPPHEEAARLQARYGVPIPFTVRQYGGIGVEAGLRRDAPIPAGAAFLWRLVRGAPRSKRWSTGHWRRLWRSVRDGRRASAPSR
jgi:hypothetical protein